MMAFGGWVLGAVFCLVGTLVLVGAAFLGLHWFLDQDHQRQADIVGTPAGPARERID